MPWANNSKAVLGSLRFSSMHFRAFPVLMSYFLHDVNEAQVLRNRCLYLVPCGKKNPELKKRRKKNWPELLLSEKSLPSFCFPIEPTQFQFQSHSTGAQRAGKQVGSVWDHKSQKSNITEGLVLFSLMLRKRSSSEVKLCYLLICGRGSLLGSSEKLRLPTFYPVHVLLCFVLWPLWHLSFVLNCQIMTFFCQIIPHHLVSHLCLVPNSGGPALRSSGVRWVTPRRAWAGQSWRNGPSRSTSFSTAEVNKWRHF